MNWADFIILLIAVVFAFQGWQRGFIIELGGFIALVLAALAAFYYPGTLDTFMRDIFNLSDASAHVAGMVAFAILVYIVLMLLSAVLSRFAKLPVLDLADSIGGAFVGVAKALVGVWVVLYFVLFLPLAPELRGDLQRSGFVALISQADAPVDAFVNSTMPWFMRPVAKPLFDRHKL
jgi:membrane protein required for colicin V production